MPVIKSLINAQQTVAVANGVQLTSWTKLGTGITTAGTALKAFLATTPAVTTALLIGAIVGAVALYDAFTVSVDEAKDALDESYSTYENTTSELESLQTQLDQTKEKMKELETGGITLVEESEYNELVKTNDELERTIKLRKIEQGFAAREARDDAVTLYDKLTEYGGDPTQERIDEILSNNHDSIRVLRDDKLDKNDLNELIAGYKLLEDQIKETETEMAKYENDTSAKSQKKYENLDKDLSSLQEKQKGYYDLISESMTSYQNIYDTLQGQKDDGYILTSEEETILKNASNALDLINNSLGGVLFSYKELESEMQRSTIAKRLQEQGLTENHSNRLANSLSEEDLEFAGQINFDEVDSIQSFYDALDKVKQEANKEENEVEVEATISDSVEQMSRQLKSQFAELADAYQNIFTDDGFTLENVDNDMLSGLVEQFKNLEEDLGVEFDTSELEDFFDVLTNGESTAEDVQNAFNDIASSWLYSTDTLENLNDETANAIEQQLEEMGVTNANEVVTAALAQRKNELATQNLYAAQTGNALANATAVEILQFANEQIQLGALTQEMAQVLMQKIQFNLNTLNTAADINNLIQLAQTAGATTETLNALNAAKSRFGSTGSANLDALRARKDAQQALKKSQDVWTPEPVEIEFDGNAIKDNAEKAGKEAADEYLEAFEKEYDNLNDLLDHSKITEKEYLDQLRKLYQKYFKDKKKYLKEYAKYENEYLNGMKDLYDEVFSYIIDKIDEQIDKLEEQRDAELDALEDEKDAKLDALEKEKDATLDALEKEKEATIERYEEERDSIIEAYEAERDAAIEAYEAEQEALDDQIEAYEDQQDALQDKIDAINDEIDAINEAAKARQRDIDLQKAQYELERMQNQRTQLVKNCQTL